MNSVRIGTRGSPLALFQAMETRRLIAAAAGLEPDAIAVETIRTSGDRISDRPLSEVGGKGLFTKEIDTALLSGAVDIAVHSAKDMPTVLPDGIVIGACLKRADVRDAFLSSKAMRLADLPEGAVVGTSSLRRRALTLRARPDIKVVDMRGNVETRLAKLEAGVADATLLAYAGLIRLGLGDRATSVIEPIDWLPAAGQGVIAITARADDPDMLGLLSRIDHRDSTIALATERAFLGRLDGSCRTPIGCLARVTVDMLSFSGMIIKPDGRVSHAVARGGSVADAERLGADAGVELATRGGPDFFATD